MFNNNNNNDDMVSWLLSAEELADSETPENEGAAVNQCMMHSIIFRPTM